jgi:hypothetical protein
VDMGVISHNDSLTCETTDAGKMPVLWLLGVAGLISGTHHLVAFILCKTQPVDSVRWIRWHCDFSISSAIMVSVLGVISGITNVFVLLGMAYIQFGLMHGSGWLEYYLVDMPEKYPDQRMYNANIQMPFYLMCIVYIVGIWVPLFTYLAINNVPDFVYVIMAVIFIAFGLFGVVYYLRIRKINAYSGPETDLLFDMLSVSAKLVLQWMLVGGVKQGSDAAIYIPMVGILVLSSVSTALIWRYRD